MEKSFSLLAFGRVFVGDGFVLRPINARIAALLAPLTVVLSMTGVSTAVSAEACPNEAIRNEQNSHLSDCRAYELVSPPVKGGADVLSENGRTRVATDGNAVEFASLGAFADISGTGITTEYLSRRDGKPGTNGWSAHGIFPKLDPLSIDGGGAVDLDTSYQADLSSDLSTGILRTFTDLAGDPMVEQVPNLFLRRDLLSSGLGSYELLTPCLVCSGTPLTLLDNGPRPFVADTTPDFGHVLFESRYNLLSGATGAQPKVYEWDHGALYLAGILPDAEGGGPAPISVVGAGALATRYTLHTISDDGSKIFFTVPPNAFAKTGKLYMRIDHTTTVQINASERTDCADDPNNCTGTPAPLAPARAGYGTATPDGSKVFFTTDEQLTDAPGSGLYVYDTTAPDSDPHNLKLLSPDTDPTSGPSVLNVMGASDDGSYVYFNANDQLVAGQPDTGGFTDIYLAHAGTVRYIGTLTGQADDETLNSLGFNWGLTRLASRVTPDGKELLFTSHSGVGLTGYDHGTGCQSNDLTCAELYRYDASSDHLACVSCNPTGAAATSDAGFNLEGTTGGARRTSYLSHPFSNDGRYVFFTSGERLVPDDRNGTVRDVYEYDAATGQLHLITSGQSPDDSYFLDASPDGANVYFSTRQRLVGWDTDNNYDIYDARVHGGFPEPRPPVAECDGDACQGTLGAPPDATSFGSSLLAIGTGNVQPVVKKVVVRSLTRSQKLNRALRKCKSKRKKTLRKKCELSARKRFGRGQ
jgi:Tol biopolymer transport system component